jgi:hypothetical protein
MRKIVTLLLLGSAAVCLAQSQPGSAAQSGPQAPPESEQALRARAAKFFQAHVDGKYRLAEQVVAEDSKDIYYAAQKPRYLKFEISRISYSENFTKATVVANCEREIATKFGVYTLNVPQESYWKVENGEWCWYVDTSVIRTPFGDTIPRPQGEPNGPPRTGESALRKGPSVDDVLRSMSQSVKADKTEVRLSAQAPSGEVMVSNSMKGAVKLKVSDPKVPGLTVKVETEQIGPQQSSRVLFQFKPQANPPAGPVKVNVQVEPGGQIIPIQVLIAAAPQPKK